MLIKKTTRRQVLIGASAIAPALLSVPFLTPAIAEAAAPIDQLVGYGAGTTGGAGGTTTTVSSLSALTSAVSGSAKKIVRVSGTITGNTNVKVGSNTTIIGVGSSASLVGISLNMNSVSNVIIRNLKISKVLASSTTGDAVHIESESTKIWVDHCDLSSDLSHGKDYYDGLLDITHGCDYITVSWNRFHDHYKVSLVGHSDSNGSEDTGHFHVTYHHNWFNNCNSRLPSIRFGTLHAYNNYFTAVGDSAIHSRENAQALVQNNYFDGSGTALTTTGDSKVDGYANASGNIYNGAKVDITRTGSFTSAPYAFTLDSASSVPSYVQANSGVGIVTG